MKQNFKLCNDILAHVQLQRHEEDDGMPDSFFTENINTVYFIDYYIDRLVEWAQDTGCAVEAKAFQESWVRLARNIKHANLSLVPPYAKKRRKLRQAAAVEG